MRAEPLCRRGAARSRRPALEAVELHRTRARTAIEMGRALSTYAADPEVYDPEGLRRTVQPRHAVEIERLISKFEGVSAWTAQELERLSASSRPR